jgi:hypothetical protein
MGSTQLPRHLPRHSASLGRLPTIRVPDHAALALEHTILLASKIRTRAVAARSCLSPVRRRYMMDTGSS